MAVAALAGCASLVPQTFALREQWPEGVPRSVELTRVPFFPQEAYQCGPAALATVLGDSGVQVTPEALVPQVWLPSRHGSLQLEMLATARRYDRVSYKLGSNYPDLLREVAAGNPVIVLQDVGLGGLFGAQWHYAVVNGFDYPSGTIYLRSGTEPREKVPFTAFERTWMKGGYWAMVTTPPDRIPATATHERWIEALVAFARTAPPESARVAYETALKRWPDSVAGAVGLSTALHQRGQLTEAAAVLRRSLQRNPQSVILLNNLAQTLSDQGRQGEALAVIDRANDPNSPFAAEVKATRAQIVERMNHKAAR
jgi:tetratricopeptide (TPR) repeat protein